MAHIEHDIQKQLVTAKSNGFVLQEMHDAVNMGDQAKPQLLTVLMGGLTSTVYSQTQAWQYDLTEYTPVLPSGKGYHERGSHVTKDVSKTKLFQIGSKGLRLNVKPQDVANRRKAGTTELMTTADLLADQIAKSYGAFDFEREREFAYLLTARKNLTGTTLFPTYDFHTEIIGAAQTASKVEFGTAATTTPQRQISKLVSAQQAKLASYGLTAARWVVVCDSDFMDKIYDAEQMVSFGRELRSAVDLASMATPTLDANGFRYANFDSPTAGVTFIEYSGAIAGSDLIVPVIGSENKGAAYLFPVLVGDSLVKEVYAPAQTMSAVNKPALDMYSWFYEDEFEGITGFYEQNKLAMLPRPDLIVELEAFVTAG